MKQDEIIKNIFQTDSMSGRMVIFFSFAINTDVLHSGMQELYFIHKLPLKIITALDEIKENAVSEYYMCSAFRRKCFLVPFIVLKDKYEFPSISKDIHEASGYERKIATFFGLKPIGNPDSRPLILHENWPEDKFPLRKDFTGKRDQK